MATPRPTKKPKSKPNQTPTAETETTSPPSPSTPTDDESQEKSAAEIEAEQQAEQERLEAEARRLAFLKATAADIKRAIHDISGQCKTQLRAVIDRYPACVSRQRVAEGDSQFPKTVRQNNRDPERCDSGAGRPLFGEVLCHHIGNTIIAFYNATVVDGGDKVLLDRLRHLQHIAAGNAPRMVVQGDERRGWLLMDHAVYAEWVASGKEIPRGIRPATKAK